MDKSILDMCCGSRMFWFDRADPRAVFVDIRSESHTLCDGRNLDIRPDIVADFRQLPFADGTFQIVVFDPPHLTHCGPEGWQGKKYGILSKSWKNDLTKGFAEAFRVLRAGGVLIFKWNEVHIPTRDIIKLSPVPPIFGHPSGKRANTNWVCFQKPGEIAQLEAAEVRDSDIIRDANRYRFLRDEDSWGEDSNSWDVETRTGLISSENLMELRLDHFDAAIDTRMAASDIPFLNPVTSVLSTEDSKLKQRAEATIKGGQKPLPRHVFSMLVNELRDAPAIGCKRQLIIGVLNRHGVIAESVQLDPPATE